MKRQLHFPAAALAGYVGLAAASVQAAEETRRRNVLLVIADGMSWKDAGYHGSDFRTTNVDRLATDLNQLDQFCVCPARGPASGSLVTRRFPIRVGTVSSLGAHGQRTVPEHVATLADTLRETGFATVELFDLAVDPTEFHDVSATASARMIVLNDKMKPLLISVNWEKKNREKRAS